MLIHSVDIARTLSKLEAYSLIAEAIFENRVFRKSSTFPAIICIYL